MFDADETREAGRETMVTIATFNESAKAKHLKERLQAAGVKADVHNEGSFQTVALIGDQPQANAKVLVEEEDFSAAQKLMVEWEAADPDIAAAIRCPQCKSPRIQYPQLARKFPIMAWLHTAILFKLKIFEKEFYCEDCHFTWRKGGEPSLTEKQPWEKFS